MIKAEIVRASDRGEPSHERVCRFFRLLAILGWRLRALFQHGDDARFLARQQFQNSGRRRGGRL